VRVRVVVLGERGRPHRADLAGNAVYHPGMWIEATTIGDLLDRAAAEMVGS
jgi:hypothetical protein